MLKQNQKLSQKLDNLCMRFQHLEFSNIFKIAYCHQCKLKDVVYSCYKESKITSCKKRYCQKCLNNYYSQNIIQILEQNRTWSCPFKKGICECHKCHSKQCQEQQQQQQQHTVKESIKDRDLGYIKGVHYDCPFVPSNVFNPKKKINNNTTSSTQLLVNDQFFHILPESPRTGQPRQSVWEQTMYRNLINDQAPVYILKGESQQQLNKSLKNSVLLQRTQGALSLNAHILKSLQQIEKTGENVCDKDDLRTLLQHNLYYLARSADFAKEQGLYIPDTRVNNSFENGQYQPNRTQTAREQQPQILQAIAHQYENYISQKNEHDQQIRIEREKKSKEFNQKQKEKMNIEEVKLRKQYEELKRSQQNQQNTIDQILEEIQSFQDRNKEIKQKLQIGRKKLKEIQIYLKFLNDGEINNNDSI